MTTAALPQVHDVVSPAGDAGRPWWSFSGAWPLPVLFVLFPLWWLLGISHFIFFVLAVPMAWELLRRRPVLAPVGFGVWLLFLVVVTAGATLLWLVPPGTVPAHGAGKLLLYGYRFAWYLGATIVALYVLNMSERELPTQTVTRLVGLMFVYTTLGGLAGLAFPTTDFPSALEHLVHAKPLSFLWFLMHPSLAVVSEFLGYGQPRPSAPFTYANSWGNNFGIFLPFFVVGWLRAGAGWLRPVGFVVLALSIVPVVYSLNRALWIGLIVAVLFVAVRLALMGSIRTLQVATAALVAGAALFVASPLYDTVTLRIETPHSDAVRQTLADDVVGATVAKSPILGYGDTRDVSGSFTSIAGGETPQCHFCKPPPLGTQGFVWRLIFTTGFLGTALFTLFIFGTLLRFLKYTDPLALAGCLILALTVFFSFVYDTLESPLFSAMIAVGLLNRRFVRPGQLSSAATAPDLRPAPR